MTRIDLTPGGEAALGWAEQLTGSSRSVVVRDALLAYAALAEMGTHEGAYRVEVEVDGRPLYLTACRTKPAAKRWWLPW